MIGTPVTSTTSTNSVSQSASIGDLPIGNNDRTRRRSSGSQTQQSMGRSLLEDAGNMSMNTDPEKNLSSRSNSTIDSDIISMTGNVQHLRNEVDRLKAQLAIAQNHRECSFPLTNTYVKISS